MSYFTGGPPVPSLNYETNIYWLKTEYVITESNNFKTAPIYEGVYDPLSPIINKKIGYVKVFTSHSDYPDLPYTFYTDNWSF